MGSINNFTNAGIPWPANCFIQNINGQYFMVNQPQTLRAVTSSYLSAPRLSSNFQANIIGQQHQFALFNQQQPFLSSPQNHYALSAAPSPGHNLPDQAPPPAIIPPQSPSPIRLPAPPTPTRQISPPAPPQTKDQTNAKIKNIKEKCITHYIDGQLIIESTRPLTEKKLKSSRKKPKLQNGPQPRNQPKEQASQKTNNTSNNNSDIIDNIYGEQNMSNSAVASTKTETPTTINHHSQSTTGASVDDVHKIRAEMRNFSVEQVIEFIERHEEIRQYSSKFAEEEFDGKALLSMIDRGELVTILTAMFKYGPAIKIEAALSKYKLNS